MPREPIPPIPSSTEAAMLQGHPEDSALARFIRKWEPTCIDNIPAFHADLTAMLDDYAALARRLPQDALREKIREEHAAGLDA